MTMQCPDGKTIGALAYLWFSGVCIFSLAFWLSVSDDVGDQTSAVVYVEILLALATLSCGIVSYRSCLHPSWLVYRSRPRLPRDIIAGAVKSREARFLMLLFNRVSSTGKDICAPLGRWHDRRGGIPRHLFAHMDKFLCKQHAPPAAPMSMVDVVVES
jgi:hypothetical protein